MAATATEDPSKVVLEADATGGIELQTKIEQETPILSARETEVGVVSSSKDTVVAHNVETEEAATTTNDLAAAVLPDQPVVPDTEVFIFYSRRSALADSVLPRKDDSIKRSNEAAIVAVGLAAAEGFTNLDKVVVPEGIHEGTPETGNNAMESGTTPTVEAQREHEVVVTAAPETEDAHPDIYSNLPINLTPVFLPAEPENSLIETELVAERQVETTSSATSVPIDVEDQRSPGLIETVPSAEKDTEEVQTQVDDTSNIKDESIPESDVAQHIEAADTVFEGPSEDVPASSTKSSSGIVQLEQEVDFLAPVEEEPSAISQVAAEDLLPKIESKGTTSRTLVETIPITEDATAPVTDVENQIIAPVDVRSEHIAVVAHGVENEVDAETQGTDAATATNELAAAESPETDQPVLPSTEVFIYFIPVEA